MGDSFLKGREATIWQDREPKEMASLMPQEFEADPFSTLVTTKLVNYWDRLWGNRRKKPIPVDPESGIVEYDDRLLNKISMGVGVTLASVVPSVSVLILYFVKNQIKRLGLLIVFTFIFSASLAAFTSARRIEIFSAVAAFSAVMVVFIGTND